MKGTIEFEVTGGNVGELVAAVNRRLAAAVETRSVDDLQISTRITHMRVLQGPTTNEGHVLHWVADVHAEWEEVEPF